MINNTQYFEGVSECVWTFYIGGYQPAQKWLKDRRERKLTEAEVIHYTKVLKALEESIRIMNEIDQIEISIRTTLDNCCIYRSTIRFVVSEFDTTIRFPSVFSLSSIFLHKMRYIYRCIRIRRIKYAV